VVRAQPSTVPMFQGVANMQWQGLTLSHYQRGTRGEAAAMRRCTFRCIKHCYINSNSMTLCGPANQPRCQGVTRPRQDLKLYQPMWQPVASIVACRHELWTGVAKVVQCDSLLLWERAKIELLSLPT